MKIIGAKVKEQGVTFGIIQVKPHVLTNSAQRANIQKYGLSLFGNIPIILAGSNGRSIKYFGRRDIVNFLSNINALRVPWKEYTTY